jgi:hypothetical protein
MAATNHSNNQAVSQSSIDNSSISPIALINNKMSLEAVKSGSSELVESQAFRIIVIAKDTYLFKYAPVS